MKKLRKTNRKKAENIKNDFIVIDIETQGLNATSKAFLFGVAYGYKIYEVFFSVKDMENYLLNCGKKYVFAHNGGKYDYLAIFGNLIKRFNTNVLYNDSRFISFKHEKTTFADSLNLLPLSVKKIGESIGLHKLETDIQLIKGNVKDISQDMIYYCKIDCKIVYKALLQLFETAGTIKITLAGLSLNYFRNYYMHTDILYNDLSIEFFKSYSGGRCEAFKIGKTNSYKYDINSMYPYVMKTCNFPNPANLKMIKNCTIDFALKKIEKFEGLIYCELIHKKHYFGFLPVKINNKLIFPIGKITGHFNFNEIRFALKHKIIDLIDIKYLIYSIDKINPFIDFINDNYNKRIQGGEADKLIYKLFLNSLYGKFAQKIETEKIYFDNYRQMLDITDTLKGKNYTIEPQNKNSTYGYIVIKKPETETYLNNTIPVFSSYITSEARILLLSKMLKYQKNIITYTDTDSIFVEKPENIENSTEIGHFKLEKSKVTHIYGLKNYKEKTEKKTIHKIKGIPKNALKKGQNTYTYTTIAAPKTAIIQGIEAGQPIEITKRIKGLYEKRIILKDKTNTKPIKLN